MGQPIIQTDDDHYHDAQLVSFTFSINQKAENFVAFPFPSLPEIFLLWTRKGVGGGPSSSFSPRHDIIFRKPDWPERKRVNQIQFWHFVTSTMRRRSSSRQRRRTRCCLSAVEIPQWHRPGVSFVDHPLLPGLSYLASSASALISFSSSVSGCKGTQSSNRLPGWRGASPIGLFIQAVGNVFSAGGGGPRQMYDTHRMWFMAFQHHRPFRSLYSNAGNNTLNWSSPGWAFAVLGKYTPAGGTIKFS